MNPFRRHPLLLCCLIAYAALLTATLLYFRFPAEQFKLFCETKLAQTVPGTRCSIADIQYRFPMSVEGNKIAFYDTATHKQQLFLISHAIIRPDKAAPTSRFHTKITTCDGTIRSSLFLQKDKQLLSMEKINVINLDLAQIPLLKFRFNRTVTGLVSGNGTLTYNWNGSQSTVAAQGNIKVENGSISLLFPVLSLKKIDFKTLKTDIFLQKKTVQYRDGSFQGKELNGTFAGDIALRTPLKQSTLSFNGTLKPLPPLLQKSRYAKTMVFQFKKMHNRVTIPFLLQGSVGQPRFSFDT